METGSGNWTWDNGTVEVECNKSLENRTWLGEQLHTGQMVDQAVSPVWYLVGVTGIAFSRVSTVCLCVC